MRALERLSGLFTLINPHLGRDFPKIEQIGGMNDYPWNEYAGASVPTERSNACAAS